MTLIWPIHVRFSKCLDFTPGLLVLSRSQRLMPSNSLRLVINFNLITLNILQSYTVACIVLVQLLFWFSCIVLVQLRFGGLCNYCH